MNQFKKTGMTLKAAQINSMDKLQKTEIISVELKNTKTFKSNKEGIPKEIHILPLGKYEYEGRKIYVNNEVCSEIIKNFKHFKLPIVVDYEHQSENSITNGKPAPALGWINDLALKHNGIWGKLESWTPMGIELIKNKAYRFISPVLVFNGKHYKTGENLNVYLKSAALTNVPFFKNLESLFTEPKSQEKGAPENTNNSKEVSMEKKQNPEEEIQELKEEALRQRRVIEEKEDELKKLTEEVNLLKSEKKKSEMKMKCSEALQNSNSELNDVLAQIGVLDEKLLEKLLLNLKRTEILKGRDNSPVQLPEISRRNETGFMLESQENLKNFIQNPESLKTYYSQLVQNQ